MSIKGEGTSKRGGYTTQQSYKEHFQGLLIGMGPKASQKRAHLAILWVQKFPRYEIKHTSLELVG